MRETLVGVFVLIGLLCVCYLTVKLGRMEVFNSSGFPLTARFDSASGLRVGADVELCGVPVGRVTAIDWIRIPRVLRLWSICFFSRILNYPMTVLPPSRPQV